MTGCGAEATQGAGTGRPGGGTWRRLFPGLTPWVREFGCVADSELREVAERLAGEGGPMHDPGRESGESDLPAAYTFFAQFVENDLGFRPGGRYDVDGLPESEASLPPQPALDLAGLYGGGPQLSPFLYEGASGRLRVGSADAFGENCNDVPRGLGGRALVPDARNDDNLILSQLHVLLMRFHNRRLVGRSFEDARRDVRLHYQWLVWNDLLELLCDPTVYRFAHDRLAERRFPLLPPGTAGLPPELWGAALRFRDSTLRRRYPINAAFPSMPLDEHRRPVPSVLAVSWPFLLDVEPTRPFAAGAAIDHLLAAEPARSSTHAGPVAPANRGVRVLQRGLQAGLASGQAVAESLARLGYPVDTAFDPALGALPRFAGLDARLRRRLEAHTPLLLYVLREAGRAGGGRHLGPVGSALLVETVGHALMVEGGLLRNPGWRPRVREDGRLRLADVVRFVGAY